MFGSHLSVASGLHKALLAAEVLGLGTVQIFTKNQQQWRCRPLAAAARRDWLSHQSRLGFTRTVSHGSYLSNLASPDPVLWHKSIRLFIQELKRCRDLRIPYLVTHPGSHMGQGEQAGLLRVAAAIDEAYDHLPDCGVTTCIEATAGQGSSLGHRLEHLAGIIELSRRPRRLGVCLDTAHLFAAGYDFRRRRYAQFAKEVDRIIGLRSVKVIHLNDSQREFGSRVDRHEHIGKGHIGLDGFRPWVRDERFRRVPKILETPKDTAPDGRDWDVVNLETLRSLM